LAPHQKSSSAVELEFEHGTATHIGGRDVNADSFAADSKKKLFVVADGVGDRLGKIASWYACHTLQHSFKPANPNTLVKAALKAHRTLRDAKANYKLDPDDLSAGKPVTTLTAIHLRRDAGHIVHAGDSSIYRLRNGGLQRLTTPKNPGIQQIGGGRTKLEIKKIDVNEGDIFLLCTDGIIENTNNRELMNFREGEIKKLLLKAATNENGVSEVAQRLIRRTLTAFSDSRTAIVIKVKKK
jgi:serine/threonine protein phosphatase PrpC